MSQNKIIVGIIAVFAIGGGVWWVSQATPTAKPLATEKGEPVQDSAATSEPDAATPLSNANPPEGQGPLRELVARGEALECTFSFTHDEGTSGTGTGYFAPDERMRMETTVTQNGETANGSYVIQNDVMYMWGTAEGQSYAMQMPVRETKSQQYTEQTPVDLDDNVSFDCIPWTVDEERFAIPEDRNFMDMGAMMQDVPEMEGMSQEDLEAMQEQFGNQ
jgi:hypothetical protein